MVDKEAYCPICDKLFLSKTTNIWAYCPTCGHHCTVNPQKIINQENFYNKNKKG